MFLTLIIAQRWIMDNFMKFFSVHKREIIQCLQGDITHGVRDIIQGHGYIVGLGAIIHGTRYFIHGIGVNIIQGHDDIVGLGDLIIHVHGDIWCRDIQQFMSKNWSAEYEGRVTFHSKRNDVCDLEKFNYGAREEKPFFTRATVRQLMKILITLTLR